MTRSEEEMTYGERDRRRLIRSVLRLASPEELLREKEQSLSCGDLFEPSASKNSSTHRLPRPEMYFKR